MEEFDLLFYKEPNQWNGTKIRGWIDLKINGKKEFTSRELLLTMEKLKKILIRAGNEEITGINLIFNNINFRDKAVYILFEVMVYYFLKKSAILVRVKYKEKSSYPGFKDSLIYRSTLSDTLDKKMYLEMFEKKMDIKMTKFRSFINKDIEKNYFSKLMGDIYTFLSNARIVLKADDYFDREKYEEYITDLSEVAIELAENAIEHSESGCLLDINIHSKKNNEISIDVVILNLSTLLLGDKLKDRLMLRRDKSINQKILEALENHKVKFNEKYTEDDFFNISAFQHRVSTRETSTDNNDGTGLTRLLESLIEKSEKSSNCYVLSGNKIIKFRKEFLKLDQDKFIGFNKENDFVNLIPAEDVIQRSIFNLSGTLYNLNFVIK